MHGEDPQNKKPPLWCSTPRTVAFIQSDATNCSVRLPAGCPETNNTWTHLVQHFKLQWASSIGNCTAKQLLQPNRSYRFVRVILTPVLSVVTLMRTLNLHMMMLVVYTGGNVLQGFLVPPWSLQPLEPLARDSATQGHPYIPYGCGCFSPATRSINWRCTSPSFRCIS